MNEKKRLRKEYINKRNILTSKEILEKSLVIQNKFLDLELYKNSKKICVYMDFKNEVKTDVVINKALDDLKEVYVPKLENDNMMFYKIDQNTMFDENEFGIKEPDKICSEKFYSSDFPSIFIVPGVIFSSDGFRIGYGGGFYDRWIEKNQDNIYIGFAFDVQIKNEIPVELHDKKMDYIITESSFLKSGKL